MLQIPVVFFDYFKYILLETKAYVMLFFTLSLGLVNTLCL